MPFGTITATESTFGSISGSIVGAVPGTLSGSVGVPGPQGPQGIQGIQGPPGPAGPGSTWGGIAGTISDQTDLWTQLGLKAPLAGPVFTGDARAVTPTFGDNDTSIATTAFVQSALQGGTANARNLEVLVRNQSGVTIPAGSIVYISGATGNLPLITLAQANNDANSAQTFGFVKASIANNGFGYVIVRGELENIDTSALTEGVQLYLSPTTPGTWTTTKPSAPQHLVYVGIVVRAHPTQGVILVAVQNGYELPELHDVSITSVTNNDLLTYESSSSLWKNKSIGTLGLATQSYVTAGFAPIGAGLPVSGTVGQVLTKNSGTNYDASWATLVPGDRYLTTSSTSNTIGTGSKTFTVGTGLSYSPQQDVVISFDASNHMHALVTSYNSGTGALVVNVQSVTGSGTYTAWTINVGGTTPLQSVEWGEILGTLGDQTDLSTALNAKLEASTAASTYAALAGATFTGEVITPASTTSNAGLTITPGVAPTTPTNGDLWATTTDLQVRLNGVTETVAEQSWVTAGFYPLSGNPSGFLTSSALTPYALLSGATFTGLVGTVASTTTTAGLNLPHGAAPTTPVNGDVWTTTSGLFARINAGTQQFAPLGSNNTFSNASSTYGSSTATGTIGVASGATISGSTKTVNVATGGVSGSTTLTTIGPVLGASTTSIGNTTAASTLNLATGATLTATTKAVNIGTSGVAGSTTNIAIGSTTGTSTTTLQGTTNGVTAAADTNSVALATTAFVVGQAGSATPLVDGTAAVGTSLRYARQDHVHPTDTSRAPLASPAFTGTPSLPTGTTAVTQTAGNNTTAVATTAFVQQEVPAASTTAAGKVELATFVESTRFSTQSLATTPLSLLGLIAANGSPLRPRSSAFTSATSGAGSSTQNYFGASICFGPNASTVGYGGVYYDAAGSWSSANAYTTPDWSKVTGFSVMIYRPSTAFDSGNTVRLTLGKAASGGTLTTRGIGVDIAAGNTFAQILAHNGTTLTTTNSTFPVSSYLNQASRHITMVSYGNGTVELFVDGVSYGTSSGGPTTAGGTGTRYSEEVYGSGTQAGQTQVWTFNASVFTGL